ncbi:protein FAR1-RELATED SEQUENCE 5-like [Salvia miltiorrhiza]|uniref:protein FAR1-RELATED SEQUENCE 5-like n=1 Tax=Salvia miltiorrhiza TaxID=226208 RepID=UPI0025AD52DB|nr:protein FAR1-RELATED SEQUENCE 5-like [Salvia miltiorrhiza]
MKSSGIGVSRAYRFLEKEAGGRANIGFTRKDVYNELNRDTRNISKVPNADVNRLLEFFTEKGRSDPSFYWRVKVGEDVDATYKTNKYNLICVPIVGINHHRTNVMFAVAFLSNERSESYAWLFDTFLDSMYGKEPSTIFSDQDHALMNGLDLTFREASHRLCQWHINKNAAKQFGHLNHDKHFKSLWYQCMSGCETAEEFESTWISMIVEHNLSEHRWFTTMYNLRKRWSSAFTRDKFSGGLHATSRSEVTNKVIKDLCKSTSSVYDFVIGFESVMESWRLTESEEDALGRGVPGMLVQQTGILEQVAKVCTRSIFKSFEYESLYSVSVKMTQEPPDLNDELLVFKVCSRTAVNGSRTVTFNQSTKFARCTCHMWETEGIMCRHFFRVYFHLNLDVVPDEMLMKRWRRESKEWIGLISDAIDCAGTNQFSNMIFVNHCTKRVYDLVARFKDDSICRSAIDEHISTMEEVVHNLENFAGNDGKSKKSFKERLHRPLKNPICKRKSRRRRKMFSKYWAARDCEVNQNSSNYEVHGGPEHDDIMGSQVPGTQGESEDLRVDADRFSVD